MTIEMNVGGAFRGVLVEGTRSLPQGNGELVVTPWSFRDGEAITVYAEPRPGGLVSLSDRGTASQNLLLAGVDTSRGSAARSWHAVKATMDREYTTLGDSEEWELALTVLEDAAGYAVREIAEASLRADALRDLNQTHSRRGRLDSRVIREAGKHDLTVIPHARVKLRGGAERPVSVKLEARSRNAYVQTLTTSNDPWGAFDKARSLFESLEVAANERISVVASDLALSTYQRAGIKEVSTLVDEREVADWMTELAA